MESLEELWSYAYDLFVWAWNWEVAGTGIQPIPLCLFIFITEFVIDVIFPRPKDMKGDE